MSDTSLTTPLQQIEIIDKPKDISSDEQAQLDRLCENLRCAFNWCFTLASNSVRRQISLGKIDPDDFWKQDQYRAKVIHSNFTTRATAWLLDSVQANTIAPFDKKLSEFTPADLTSLLDLVRPAIPPQAGFKEALMQLGDDIIHKNILNQGPLHPIYWVAVARVSFDTNTRLFKAILQEFLCQLTIEQYEKSEGVLGHKTTHVKITPALIGGQYDFYEKGFEDVKDAVEKTIREGAQDAIQGANQ